MITMICSKRPIQSMICQKIKERCLLVTLLTIRYRLQVRFWHNGAKIDSLVERVKFEVLEGRGGKPE